MIKINNLNSGDAHFFFELLRIYFPYYEENEDLILSLASEDNSNIIKIEFPNNSFFLNLEKNICGNEFRKFAGSWIVHSVKDQYKVESPWGILTGIRPIKFVQKLRKENSNKQTFEKLTKDYLLSQDLAKLIIDIAVLESSRTCDLDKYGYSLYINIPFCPSRCHYCSYPTIKNQDKNVISRYMELLMLELKNVLEVLDLPTSIYIGGGTPTSIPIKELDVLLNYLDKFSIGQEYTLEAGRPDTLSKEMLEMVASHKVNRISINPQSMVDKTLNLMGRKHNSLDIINGMSLARNIGNWDINMDLILGLPGEGKDEILYTLEKVIDLEPENITVHTLSLKNGSKLFEKNLVEFREMEDLEKMCLTNLTSASYIPYYMYRQKRILGNGMNIGYSKVNKESIYNMIMMEELQSVIGFGMSSTSKILFPDQDRLEKFSNQRNLRDYEKNIDIIIEKKLKLLKG